MHTHRRLFARAVGVPDYIVLTAIMSLLLTVVIIVQMFSLSLIIAEVFARSQPPANSLLLVFGGSVALRGLLVWQRERLARQKSVRIKSALRKEAFSRLLGFGPVHARSEQTGGVIHILTEGTEKLEDYFTHYIPSLIHIAILPPVIILFVFYLDWPSAIILLITGPLIVFFMWLIGTYAKKISQDQWASFNRLSAKFLDALQGMKTLKLFGESESESVHIADSSDQFRVMTMRVLRIAFLSGMVLELAASISIAMVALQVGIRLIEGMMPFQPGLFVLLLAPEFYLPFRALGQHHHAGMEGSAAASGIFDVIDRPARDVSGSNSTLNDSHGVGITCQDLRYAYPGQGNPAIVDVNCTLPPGKLCAIIGHSGSGKTTFINLLLGYLQPDQGTICVNEQGLHALDPDAWRQQVAYVSQHPHFFHGTVLENLRLARPGADMEAVREVAKEAGADDFIMDMPKGYDSTLEDNASRLSGGERQRLALARALLRKAPVLILDEPTSYLDPESEQLVIGAALKKRPDRTTIVIAHRLKTIQHADQILVFNEGCVAEAGNHRELMERRGIYHGYLDALGLGGGSRK